MTFSLAPGVLLTWATAVLSGGAALGTVLAVVSQLGRPKARVWWPAAVHGAVGASGFALLGGALRGPPRGVRMGAGSFGLFAAYFFAGALALGLLMAAMRLRGKPSGILLVGTHATVAIIGLVLLVAYLSAPA